MALTSSLEQVCHALSSCRTWQLDDGDFHGGEFFDSIVKLFKDDEEWAADTLRWWNTCVSFQASIDVLYADHVLAMQLGFWQRCQLSRCSRLWQVFHWAPSDRGAC